jgi:unsaturated rhamnogalacturonyl hydrolase
MNYFRGPCIAIFQLRRLFQKTPHRCTPPTGNFLLPVLLFIPWFFNPPIAAQDSSKTVAALTLIVERVLTDATFLFIDQRSGHRMQSPLQATPDLVLSLESRYNDWRYWNGILNIAMIHLGEVLKNPAYAEFALKNVAFSFDNYLYFQNKYNGEGKWNYSFGQRFILEELDDCGAMGASVIEVQKKDPQERYRKYIEQAAEHIRTRQHRLEDGTLVRSFPRRWTIWADDLYMGISFLARMREFTGEMRYFDDAVRQVINYHRYLFDEKIGLMYHCWYSDSKSTGIALWGRANGWALLAQVDLLDRLPKNHPHRDTLIQLLQRHLIGISRYQDKNGLWHQLLDKSDSYLETSCSAMFVYAFARSVDKGYISPDYASIARNGWKGLLSKIHPDGQIEGICTGTVVSDDVRDYYNRPAPLNDVHGIGTVLLAGCEMLQLH